MHLLKQLVIGIYLGAGYLALLLLGDWADPSLLSGGALATLGIISLFSMMVLDSIYSLR